MAGLTEMMQRTQLLLNDQNFDTVNDEDIIRYINMARGQIAGQAECIRALAPLAVSAASQQYLFSQVALSVSGVQGILHVRQATYAIGTGKKALHTRNFPYFNSYYLSQPAPVPGPPSVWSQYGQGTLGTLFVNLLDQDYVLTLDTVCYPIDLVDDSTAEALPYQWTDAVPMFSAYFACLTMGDAERAKMFFDEYQKFVGMARGAATPSVLPGSFAQAPDPFMQNRLGLQQRGNQ